jgi:hypothetical protein
MRLSYLTFLIVLSVFFETVQTVYLNIFQWDYPLMQTLCEHKLSWFLDIAVYLTFFASTSGIFVSIFVASGTLFQRQIKER